MNWSDLSQSSRRTGIGLLLVGLMSGCAPAIITEIRPEVSPLPPSVGQEQLGYFREDLKGLGITVLTLNSYQYQGTEAGAFLKIIQGFYQDHPGFCPLENAFFFKENPLGVYMTITARGNQVAAIAYDQRQKPKFTYTVFLGLSSEALATTCVSGN